MHSDAGAPLPLTFCGSKVGATFRFAMISIGRVLKSRPSQRHRNIVFPTPEMEDAADKSSGKPRPPPTVMCRGDGELSHGLKMNYSMMLYHTEPRPLGLPVASKMRMARLQISHEASWILDFIRPRRRIRGQLGRLGRSARDVLDLVHTRFSRQDTPGTDSSRAVSQSDAQEHLEAGCPRRLNIALSMPAPHLCTDARASRWDLSATASPRVRVDSSPRWRGDRSGPIPGSVPRRRTESRA